MTRAFSSCRSHIIFSQEDENGNHKVNKPANKVYCGPGSVQSAKNLQTPILPVYNVQIKPPLTASSCGRLNIFSRRAAAARGGKKAPRWCVHRWREPVLTALPLILHQMTHRSFWGEGDSCVGTLRCLHAVWASFRPHFDEFGGILTLVWPSVLGALWSTCSGELW